MLIAHAERAKPAPVAAALGSPDAQVPFSQGARRRMHEDQIMAKPAITAAVFAGRLGQLGPRIGMMVRRVQDDVSKR
jgi:hypothetical protein